MHLFRDQQGRHLPQALYHTTLRMRQLSGTAFPQQQPWLLRVSFLGRSFQLVLSRDKGASGLVLLSRFDRIWFIFLFTCFQGKENVAEGATSLSSISVSNLLVTCPHLLDSIRKDLFRTLYPSLCPLHIHNPSTTFLFSQVRPVLILSASLSFMC